MLADTNPRRRPDTGFDRRAVFAGGRDVACSAGVHRSRRGRGQPARGVSGCRRLACRHRQAIAADLGFSETVFVNDAARGDLRIHTPGMELPLAGHPLVGTAWLLTHQGRPVRVLRPPAGEGVATWSSEDRTWISARPEWARSSTCGSWPHLPRWTLTPARAPTNTCRYGPAQGQHAGHVRVRVFPTAMGIVEDEDRPVARRTRSGAPSCSGR